jgi:hypothetical protein
MTLARKRGAARAQCKAMEWTELLPLSGERKWLTG